MTTYSEMPWPTTLIKKLNWWVRKWTVDPSAHSYYKLTTTYFPVCSFNRDFKLSTVFKVPLGRLTIVELHPLLYSILCICTQIGIPFNLVVLFGRFTNLVDRIMSETHELEGSTVALYSMTPKMSYLIEKYIYHFIFIVLSCLPFSFYFRTKFADELH